jgi:Flp pilus assembly protein TadG
MWNGRRLLAKLRSKFAQAGGNVAIITGITLPLIVGACGLGADVGYWYFEDRNLQNAADIAAYDGAVALSESDTTAQVTTIATAGANANQWTSLKRTITVNTPPTSGTHKNANSVEVIITENAPRFFSGIFSSATVPMTARGVASASGGGQACILALDPKANQAVTVSGSAAIDSPNCDVVADSTASNAIDMSGSAKIDAACIATPGTALTTSGLTLTLCKTPTNGAKSVPDPYASVPAPSVPGSCLTVPSGTTITLSPGYYCHGLSVSGLGTTATFQSGLYYVLGNLAISGGASASGSAVTFYVTGGQTAISGGTTTNFSAPGTGTYQGIVFFGSRSGNTSTNNNFSGGSSSTITGAVYYPTEIVTFSGNSTSGTGCTQVVGDLVTISGTANLDSSCAGVGTANINVADGSKSNVTMVE